MYRSTGVSYAPRAYVGATGTARVRGEYSGATGLSHAPGQWVGATGQPRVNGLRGLLTNQDGSTSWWKVGLAAVGVLGFVWWVIPRDQGD